MNWSKVLITGIVGGVVLWFYSFLMHGVIMGATYARMTTTFVQDGSPINFLIVEIFIGLAGAVLFAKTRSIWAAGAAGGATFGFFVGLVAFFPNFFDSLLYIDFPYYLSWCWGGIDMIGWIVFGTVASFLYKPAA